MKLFTITLSAAALMFTFNTQAHANHTLKAADASISTEVCMAVASNKPLRLYKTLKENRLSLQKVTKNIRCNDLTLHEFATKHSAERIASNLQRYQKEYTLYSAIENVK